MSRWRRTVAACVMTGLLGTMLTGTAWAAEDREKIGQIDLHIDADISVGDDSGSVNVTAESDRFYVDDVEITNDDGEWTDGEVPRIEVTLEAKSGYYFSSKSSGIFDFSGDDADFVSASIKNDKETMVVTIKLDPLEGSMEIDSAMWEEDESPMAVWDEAEGAVSYEVRLYRGSSSVTELIVTNNNYYNFSSYITRTGDYHYKVRAINSRSKKGPWTESDELYVGDEELNWIRNSSYSSGNTAYGWILDNNGWWYRNPDGSYTTNGWQLINNVWYAFDGTGYMRTGWIAWNGVWYYCDASGAMLANTYTPDGYWVGADGVWVQ